MARMLLISLQLLAAPLLAQENSLGLVPPSSVESQLIFQTDAELKDVPSCDATIESDSGEKYWFQMHQGRQDFRVPLKEGVYRITKMRCLGLEIQSYYKDSFTVMGGKVNYLGNIQISATRINKSVVVRTKITSTGLDELYDSLSGEEQANLVFAFTSKSIDRQMIASSDTRLRYRVTFAGKAMPSIQPGFEKCLSKETLGAPMTMGRLDFTATYSNGSFQEMKNQVVATPMSDGFLECVEDTLKAVDGDGGDFEISVFLMEPV